MKGKGKLTERTSQLSPFHQLREGVFCVSSTNGTRKRKLLLHDDIPSINPNVAKTPATSRSISSPDPGDGLSTVDALSTLEVDFTHHITRTLDDYLLAFWAEGVFSFMAWNVSDVNVFEADG